MKKLLRLCLGSLACGLLLVGLGRAAEVVDLVSQPDIQSDPVILASPDCVLSCDADLA